MDESVDITITLDNTADNSKNLLKGVHMAITEYYV